MGKSHSDSFQFQADMQTVCAVIRDPRFTQFLSFRFMAEAPEPGGIKFTYDTSVSMTSWGEIIEIHVGQVNAGTTQVMVKSKCALPTQLFDMGKNKGNVTRIHNYLMSAVGAYQQYAPVQPQQPVYAASICRNCGTQLNGTSRFCHVCGTQIF